MIALYKDPNGENIFNQTTSTGTSGGDLSDAKIVALEKKVKELELQLIVYKVEE